MSQQGLTPKLRFPAFRKGPGWECKPLGEIAEIKLGKMLDSKKHTTGHLLPYLNNISVRWNEVDTSNLPQMFFDDDELGRFGLKAGDVVVCEGGEPGRSAVWGGRLPELKFQKAIHRVRFNSAFDPRLFVLYLETISGTTHFESLFTGGGIKHLTRETFARLSIPIPSLAEQQKIADCLSSLDDLIAAEGRKLESLRAYKKGLMQQLFPRAGETTPRLRFPEFRKAREWEETTIGKICKLKAGEFVSASNISEGPRHGLFPCYGGNGLRGYVASFTHDGMFVLIGRQGALCGNVNLFQAKFHATEHALVVTPNERVETHWMFYALGMLNLNRFSIGQAQPGLSVGVLNGVTLLIPSEEAEQQRISAFLSSLDEQISVQSRRIESLKLHKKGLMQQLFPSAGEDEHGG